HEARIGLGQGVEPAGVQIVVPAVEIQLDAMVEDRSEMPHIELTFHDAREPVVSGPAIEKVAIGRETLAVGREETLDRTVLAKRESDRVLLVGAVAAVWLTLAAHPVDQRLLRAVVQRVD